LDKWATVATSAVNVVVRAVEVSAPVVEQASQVIAHVASSPKTVEVLEVFAGLVLFAEEVEAEGGDLDAFVLVTARAGLGRAGVKPDAQLRVVLRQLVRQQRGEFPIRYLMDLTNHHRIRLVRPREAKRIHREAADLYDRLRKNPDHRLMQSLLGLGESPHKRLESEIPGALTISETGVPSREELMRRVEDRIYNDNRRLGLTRKLRENQFGYKEEQIISLDARPPEYEDPFEDPRALASFTEKENELWIREIAQQGILQPRQLEILALWVLRNLSPSELAAELGISRSTVDVHLSNIRRAMAL
jgi:hypothetical protein